MNPFQSFTKNQCKKHSLGSSGNSIDDVDGCPAPASIQSGFGSRAERGESTEKNATPRITNSARRYFGPAYRAGSLTLDVERHRDVAMFVVHVELVKERVVEAVRQVQIDFF
jgi:hypothetical protein